MLRRQTLIMLPVMAFVVLMLAIPLWLQRRALAPSGPPHLISFGSATLLVPDRFSPPERSSAGGWERLSMGGPAGRLILAWEPLDERDFPQACTRWFGLPGYAPGPLSYEKDGCRWFFKELPLFAGGAYALQKCGKRLRLITCFEADGVRHWVQLDTFRADRDVQRGFHALLASLRLSDGSTPGPALARSLSLIPEEAGWRFAFPLELTLLFPLGFLVLVTLIQALVRRRSGRIPPEAPGRVQGGLEIALIRPFQMRFMDAALGLTGDTLTVYTFGSPLLVVPRRALAGRISEGRGWFGVRYVQLDLEAPLDFRKMRWQYGGNRGLRIRIYTPDPLGLMLTA
nr:hypothetical protein [uncultured Holophaga sp.]